MTVSNPTLGALAARLPARIVAAVEGVAALSQGEHADEWWHEFWLREVQAVNQLMWQDEPDRSEDVPTLLELAARPDPHAGDRRASLPDIAVVLADLVARQGIALGDDGIARILQSAVAAERDDPAPVAGARATALLTPVLGDIEFVVGECTADERAPLDPLLHAAIEATTGPTSVDLPDRLRRVLRAGEADFLPLQRLELGEPLGRSFAAAFEASPEQGEALTALFWVLDALPYSGKPSKRWTSDAVAALGGLSDAAGFVHALVVALRSPGAQRGPRDGAEPGVASEAAYRETNERFGVGVLRLAGLVGSAELLPSLAQTVRYMLQVIGGQYGSPRSLKLANAAVVAIADAGLPESITELQALQRSVRHGSLLNQIKKSIDALAAAQGITTDQLLEQAVERHHLASDGTREEPLARGSARIAVTARAASLTYVDEHGKEKKSFPADVKDADTDALSVLREELKGIRKTVAGERHRLDGLLAADRRWSVDDWRRFYLDHPVTGRITRDLIWVFEPAGADTPSGAGPSTLAIVGRPVDATTVLLDDGTTAPIPDHATVSLWHPVLAVPTAVGAWRQHCLDHALVQPVKQAFREIYVITPAERETATYSNRFAGHVFKQVQSRALMKGRGWKAPPLAWWDDGRDFAVATLERDGLVAEFVYDPIEEIHPDGGDLYPLCTSDQVRFRAADGQEPIALADVPAVAFSEVMRDVDLVIGVTSIGADPEWEDRGPDAIAERLRHYWNDYGFGELGAGAEVRRELIAGLLPSLAIADRCTLEDRFLVVRGDLRTYRIHLGSGNIQMEPNAEYLCIVTASRAASGKLFLPLDDDPVLTLILSKAFLLAADGSITDETIVEQIKRR